MRKQVTVSTACLALLALATAAQAQFSVRGIDAPGTEIDDINEAEALLLSEPTFGTDSPGVINYFDGFSDADFSGGTLFPGLSGTNDYALDATGFLTFNTPGNYLFQVNSDDGFRLRFDGLVVSEFVGQRPPGDTNTGVFAFSVGDTSSLRLTFFERQGGDEIELSYSLNSGPQLLVGSTSDITVTPAAPTNAVPEGGATFALLGLSMASVMIMRRRCC